MALPPQRRKHHVLSGPFFASRAASGVTRKNSLRGSKRTLPVARIQEGLTNRACACEQGTSKPAGTCGLLLPPALPPGGQPVSLLISQCSQARLIVSHHTADRGELWPLPMAIHLFRQGVPVRPRQAHSRRQHDRRSPGDGHGQPAKLGKIFPQLRYGSSASTSLSPADAGVEAAVPMQACMRRQAVGAESPDEKGAWRNQFHGDQGSRERGGGPGPQPGWTWHARQDVPHVFPILLMFMFVSPLLCRRRSF